MIRIDEIERKTHNDGQIKEKLEEIIKKVCKEKIFSK
jgi:hypothetical protein